MQASRVIVVIQRIFLMHYGGCGVSKSTDYASQLCDYCHFFRRHAWHNPGQRPPRPCAEVGRGLHATLNARAGYAGDLSLETLEFQLMNDSDQTKDSSTESWTLVIDDQDAIDPGGQLWMGGRPGAGYGTGLAKHSVSGKVSQRRTIFPKLAITRSIGKPPNSAAIRW